MAQAVTYCRVSSEEQAAKDISIPAQRKALHRWVDEDPKVALAADFVDEGQSAYAPADRRPGFCEMVAYCRKNDVDLILVHKLDRFSRNREESILFKSLLKRHGVQVKSITENYDPETPQGFLYEGMIEVINQFYSMNLATETMKGMRENAERGFHNGGRVPYGYRLTKVTNGSGREHAKLVPGPQEEVAVIREIFELAGNRGIGGRRITNLLNARKVPAPRSRHWSTSTIHVILNNRVYVGDQVWNRSSKAGRHGRKKNDMDSWIVTENAHEALVARELFDKRKQTAKTRGFRAPKSSGRPVNYLLGRLIRCGHCGHYFSGRRSVRARAGGKKAEVFHYYCSGYLNKGRSVCPSFGLERDWVESVVLRLIEARICTPAALDELERKVRERIEARRSTYGQDPKAVQQKLAEIDRRIDNYFRAIGQGLDPLVCQQHIAELRESRAEYASEAKVLSQDDYYERAMEKNLGELRRFSEAFQQGFGELPFEVRRQVVLAFVKDIVLVDAEKSQGKELQITLRVPFDNHGIRMLTDGEASVDGASGDGSGVSELHPALSDIDAISLSRPLRGAISLLTGTTENEVLVTWVIEADLPPRPGFGTLRRRPRAEALRPRRGASVRSGSSRVPRESRHESRHSRTASRGASAGIAPRDPESRHGIAPPPASPWAERRASIKAHLDRARGFARRLDEGEVESAAELARDEGLTRARVSQLMRLLRLAPAIQAEIDDVASERPMLKEKVLRKLPSLPSPEAQVERFAELLAKVEAGRSGGTASLAERGVRRRGFQHLFEQGRRCAALLDGGAADSYAEVGENEGVSADRVGQLLLLLHLAQGIIEMVDVPAADVPKGVTELELRKIARLREPSDQWRAFHALMDDGAQL